MQSDSDSVLTSLNSNTDSLTNLWKIWLAWGWLEVVDVWWVEWLMISADVRRCTWTSFWESNNTPDCEKTLQVAGDTRADHFMNHVGRVSWMQCLYGTLNSWETSPVITGHNADRMADGRLPTVTGIANQQDQFLAVGVWMSRELSYNTACSSVVEAGDSPASE